MEKDRKNKSQSGKPRRDRNDHRDSRPSRDYRGASSKYDHVDRAAQAKETASIATDDQESCGIVIGRNAVRELLHSERTIDKLLVQRGEREGSIVVLVAQALEKKIPVVEVDRAKLDAIAGFAPHQGIIAMAAEKEYVDVEDILAIARERGEDPIIAIADGIPDPYNLGALIRCAERLRSA